MALSNEAMTAMGFIEKEYKNQGYPPIEQWPFQMPQKVAAELSGEGLIELCDTDLWVLSSAGHQWVMTRR